MKRLMRILFALTMVVVVCWSQTSQAVQVRRNMLRSRLAVVDLKSKLDIQTIQEQGGIFDHYNGREHRVYLLPEDFDNLRARGFSLRWLTEAEINGDRPERPVLDEYHVNDDIETEFIAWQAAYPDLFSYESVGLSEEGRDMWVCKLSDTVTVDQPEIEVKYISTMHGDEVVGLENCLKLIDTLLTGYGTDPELTELMEEFEIFIMPLMNPDGRAVGTYGERYNANGVDLNRDFPDRIWDSTNTTGGRAAETAVVMNWSASRNFVLSANFHGGAVVANYPWDSNPTGASVFSPSPENTLFHQIALNYSQENSTMYNGSFDPDGTTNGADWYHISGGMQDWNYVWMGDKEVTMELSLTKSGPESALDSLWNENRESMIQYLLFAQEGVRGRVTDAITGDPLHAEIMLSSITYVTYSDVEYGQYYRILLPGTYELTFSAPGYLSQTFSNVSVSAGTPTILDVQLTRPQLTLIPDELFEAVPLCDSVDVELTLRNDGGITLDWQAAEPGASDGRFSTNNDAGGPAYSWIDISASGTEVNYSTDDQSVNNLPIGFSFPFYGQTFTTYNLSANGYLSFTSTETGQPSYANTSLPNDTRPENMIAPWWDDQSPQRSGAHVYRYSSGDSLIVSFVNIESFSGGGLYNYQMILLPDGRILFQYGDMGTNRRDEATVGMQNSDQTAGLTISFNDTFVQDNFAIAICQGSSVELIPANGSLAPAASQQVIARLRSCCLPEGLYETSFVISSSDPELDWEVLLPITMDVGGTLNPDPVVDLVVNPEGSGLRLNWSPSTGATEYEIWKGSTPDFSTSTGSYQATTSATSWLDTDLSAETSFYFVIALH